MTEARDERDHHDAFERAPSGDVAESALATGFSSGNGPPARGTGTAMEAASSAGKYSGRSAAWTFRAGAWFPALQLAIFPHDQNQGNLLAAVTWIGLLLLLVSTGLETDLDVIVRR